MVDILAFGAHPDDIEFGCGGILARMAAQNKSIVMADLTLGEKGTSGSREIRRQEGEASAALIRAKRICLDFADGEIFDSYEGRLKFVKVIREYRPKLILASMWKGEQTHPDHLACGLMARYACRYARFEKLLPELPPHQPQGILHYLTSTQEQYVDFLIDISDYVEIWKQMMTSHQSQMQTFDYINWNFRTASKLGVLINKPFAQGLAKGNPLEIDDLMTLSKSILEI